MTTVLIDPVCEPGELRAHLYSGQLVVLTKLASVSKFVQLARDQLTELFAPHEPQLAHEHFSPEELARLLGVWKPSFIHSQTAKALTAEIIGEAGFDPTITLYDVPKPRTAYPVGHLTIGIAYAFPWHRDTWYGAPAQQINWWLPIWQPRTNNAMGFDTTAFSAAVANNSAGFDYYQANKERANVSQHTKSDPRSRPGAFEWSTDTETVLLPAPGSIILFSGSHLHRTIPNTSALSRYSIDFRTINEPDVIAGIGAKQVDVESTGTALRDFVRLSDGTRLDETVVRNAYPEVPPEDAMLIFEPSTND